MEMIGEEYKWKKMVVPLKEGSARQQEDYE